MDRVGFGAAAEGFVMRALQSDQGDVFPMELSVFAISTMPVLHSPDTRQPTWLQDAPFE
jgi:hypothetical protein